MIANNALINKLRSLGFEYKRQADRVCIYKQRGTTLRAMVRRHDQHDDDYVRIILRQAGVETDEIERFIATYGHNGH